MRKILLCFMCIIMAAHSFCQTSETMKDYLRKSKKQKKAAIALLVGGTVVNIVGIAVALSGGPDQAFGSPDADKNQTLAGVLMVSGTAAMLGSIPLFIASGKNKKKARSAAVIIERIPVINFTRSFTYQPYPAIGLRFPLNKF